MDIDLATNEELIEELMRRATFRGVVVWQRESFKDDYDNDQFRWRSVHCSPHLLLTNILPLLPKED